MRVLAGEPAAAPPVWLMRQAGRYLPEYRRLRQSAASFLDLCYTPELAVEITLQPVRRFDFDAAILFSDILVVPDGMGMTVGFEDGHGPVLVPVRNAGDLAVLDPDRAAAHCAPVYEAVSAIRATLAPGENPDRVRRRALDGGDLRRGRRQQPDVRDGQGLDVARSRGVRAADRHADGSDRRSPVAPDRRRRGLRADLRELGRRSGGAGVPALRRRRRPGASSRPCAPGIRRRP